MKALLILGGREIPIKEYAVQADIIVCADSGAESAINQDIAVNILIGDMDSISNKSLTLIKEKGAKIISLPVEKDKTDGEAAIDYAKSIGVSELAVVCAEGSIDHFLGNVNLLLYAKELGLNAIIHTHDMTVYTLSGEKTFFAEVGARVSVLPAGGEILLTEPNGLYYPISEPARIKPGQTLGLGNHTTDKSFSLNVMEGTAFVMIEKRT